jgi:3-hydroxyisobutyrate dehydrogenase-like beta-hydroxyacid dehydrogenase
MRVTVIGMGGMGRAFATRALERGHHVTVWNRSPGRAETVVAQGAVEAPLERAVGDADVVLLVLSDDDAVLEVCERDGGVLASLGSSTVLANVSTVSPDTVRHLAAVGPADRVLDAPVMGAPENVAAGHCRFFVGGPLAAVTSCDPLWTDLGVGYTHCGPVGMAAIMKLISNLLLITGVASLAEAIATARSHGISDELLQNVFGESPVISPTSAIRLGSVIDPGHPGWFSPTLARKDVRLAVGLAQQAGLPVRVGPAADALLTTVVESGEEWPDFSAVIEALAPSTQRD